MKTFLLITSLLFSTALSFAANGHVTVSVEVESERGKKDIDKNSRHPMKAARTGSSSVSRTCPRSSSKDSRSSGRCMLTT